MLIVEQLESRDCPAPLVFDVPDFTLAGGRLMPPDGHTILFALDSSLSSLQGVTPAEVRFAVEAALNEWVSRVPLTLREVAPNNAFAPGQVVLKIEASPIDGPLGVLAQGSLPASAFFGTLHIRLDNAEQWTVSEEAATANHPPLSLRKVVEHEFGHVLGLGHQEDASIPAIMQPSYTDAAPHLTQDDVDGATHIYGVGLGSIVPLKPQGIGVFDPATGTWYLRSEASAGAPNVGVFQFGAPGWIPVVGQWDGVGVDRIGVVDPTTNTLYEAVPSGVRTVAWDGQAPEEPPVDRTTERWTLPHLEPFAYGAPGWIPVLGRWA